MIRYTLGMLGSMLRDPKVRRAYLTTKVGMIAAAGLLTVPLAQLLGPRVWYGFGLFVAVMVAIAAVVLALGRIGGETAAADEDGDDDSREDPESSPDADTEVVLPIEDSIDLHPFPPADIPDVVADYLEAAHAAGFREVRLIHGRGIGVQRERVRSLLTRHPLVIELHDAPPPRGGWGATVAYLKS